MTSPSPTTLRKLYPVTAVQDTTDDQVIVKYMHFWKFRAMVRLSSLYFRRIDGFRADPAEGYMPTEIWGMTAPALRDWYDRCKAELFVCCWNLDAHETHAMWHDYAGDCGVRIQTTVGALREELGHPAFVSPAVYSPEELAWAERCQAALVDCDDPPHDAFTTGLVDYIDFIKVHTHKLMKQGPSNVAPAFWKQGRHAGDHEYRAILRTGSVSGRTTRSPDQKSAHVPVRLARLVHEIRYAPATDNMTQCLSRLLSRYGFSLPCKPTTLI